MVYCSGFSMKFWLIVEHKFMDKRKRSVRCSITDTTDRSRKFVSLPRRTERGGSAPTMTHAVGPAYLLCG